MNSPFSSLRPPIVWLLAWLTLASAAFPQADNDEPAPDAPPERTIYVPYRDLKGVFDKLGAGVFVPYSEWLEMRRRLEQGAPHADDVPAVITESAYVATIEKDLVRINARFKINVLGTPWVEIPVKFGDAAVGKLDGPDGKVLLRGTGQGTYALLLAEQGEQEVTLELVARVQTSPEGREFALDVPPVGMTSLEIVIPEADQAVELTPQAALEPLESEDGQTRVRADLGATGRIAARWHPRVSRTPDMELLSSVTNLTQISIEDGLIRTDAWLTFEVLRGSLSQIRLEAPVDQRILDVNSPARIKAWRTEESDGRQVITVDLLNPADKQVVVEIHAERKLPEGEVQLAGRADDGAPYGIHAIDAAREAGQLVVRNAPDLDVALSQQQGLIRIEPAQVNERIRAEGMPAFKFYSPRFTLAATARPVEPRLLLSHVSRVTLREDEARLAASLVYTIERAGVFQLQLALPEALVVDDVQCPVMKEFSVDDATRTLVIDLAERTLGQVNIAVAGHVPLAADESERNLTLPILDPQGVTRENGTIQLFARDSLEVVTNDEQITAAQPLPAPPGERSGDVSLTAAWSFTRRPVAIPVTVKRKSPRLAVDVATSVNVLPQSTEVRTHVDFHVQFAGIDTFQLQVPEAISSSLQIEAVQTDPASPAIKQKVPLEPEDGWVVWTIEMQRDVVGLLRLALTYEHQSDESDAAAADEADGADDDEAGPATDQIAVSLVRPLPAPESDGRDAVPISRVRGEVAVRHESSLAVSASASGGDIEPVDVRELTLLPGEGTLAYRYFEQPADATLSLNLTRTRHDIYEVVATVARRVLVEIVNGPDGTAIYRVRMRVKSTERQRLQVDLPSQLELIGVNVNGREVKLEQAEPADEKLRLQGHYVPVARTTSADQEFGITFDFRWKVNPHLGQSDFLRGALELPLPVLGGYGTPAAVQEMRLAIWVPREYALVGEPEDFVCERDPRLFAALSSKAAPVSEKELDAWIGASDSDLAPRRQGLAGYVYSKIGGAHRVRVIWWNRVWMTIIVSAAVALIAWVLGRTGWENKLWWLLAGMLVLALIAMKDADWVAHAVSAARFGLVFLVVWWLISSLFAMTRHQAGVRAATAPAGAAPAGEVKEVSEFVGTPPVLPPPAPDDASRDSSNESGDQ